MRVETALERISEIHAHLTLSQVYRGYRAAPSLAAGLIALAAASLQGSMPGQGVPGRAFFYYWSAVALVCLIVAGSGPFVHYLRDVDPHARRRTRVVTGQLAASIAIAVVATVAMVYSPPAVHTMGFVPGLWAAFFGLGLVASRPFLPQMIGWVALYYLFCAAALLLLASDKGLHALTPWAVGLPFGVGHLLSGFALYWNLERRGDDV